MEEYKSCPFCGGRPGLYLTDKIRFLAEGEEQPNPYYSIKCSSCSCGTSFHSSIDKAIETWNKRTK